MPVLAENCQSLCECFAQLLELSTDQAALYQEVRKAIRDKAWAPLNQSLERMETLAREQGRLSKQAIELRVQLQKQLQKHAEKPFVLNQEAEKTMEANPTLWTISSLLPLLPEEQRTRLRSVWHKLRSSLANRQSELQVLEHYSHERQELIQGFLAALKDDEQDCGRAYSRGGRGQYRCPVAEAPSRIFNSEA